MTATSTKATQDTRSALCKYVSTPTGTTVRFQCNVWYDHFCWERLSGHTCSLDFLMCYFLHSQTRSTKRWTWCARTGNKPYLKFMLCEQGKLLAQLCPSHLFYKLTTPSRLSKPWPLQLSAKSSILPRQEENKHTNKELSCQRPGRKLTKPWAQVGLSSPPWRGSRGWLWGQSACSPGDREYPRPSAEV